MKRKRGHKKGKQKILSDFPESVTVNTDDNSLLDEEDPDDELDDDQLDSNMEVEVPDPVVSNRLATFENANPDGLGVGRVKVKLKSSKLLEPQHTYSDMQGQSDTDKSSQRLGLENQSEVVKTDDGANSLPQRKIVVYEKSSRKAGTLKFKSSSGIGSLDTKINLSGSTAHMQDEMNMWTASDNGKIDDLAVPKESQHREPKFPLQHSRYNEQELTAALTVIKKIMRMDAAEPFNIPVDPEALGIPDYFEVIDTPMDFGTICNNLECGKTYMNSKDVFKDVQFIWENCYKYNNKGDYIVDLMRRVKKNFMKYWVAAGLYVDQQKRTNAGGESIQTENAAQSSQEKHVKATPSKNKKSRRNGISHHKSDCLCAVCVVRRKRKEREANARVENEIEISDGNHSQDVKQEEAGTPFSEDASSNQERTPDPGADADMEEQMKSERSEQQGSPPYQEKQNMSDQNGMHNKDKGELGSGGLLNLQTRSQEITDSGLVIELGSHRSDRQEEQTEEPDTAQKLQQKQEESKARKQQIEMYKKLFGEENQSVLELCRTLFPGDVKSIWNGPHSLAPRKKSMRGTSGIHAAIAMLMK